MDILGQEGRERAWSQVFDLYIKPELDKRSDLAWTDVHTVLIRLPKDREPIVEFNDEVQIIYAVEDPFPRDKGDVLKWYELREIEEICPPKVDNGSVAFIFVWQKQDHIYFAFDFSPNWPDFDEANHKLGAGLNYRLECEILERVLAPMIPHMDKLQAIGVSVFPALIPYPLNAMVKHLLDCEKDKAYEVLEDRCIPDFIRSQMDYWYAVQVFEDRSKLFEEALEAHSCGRYHLSINALIGQIEGIITDWLHQRGEANTPRAIKSKFKEFQRLLESVIPMEAVESVILQSVSSFLVSPDTILRSFSDWTSPGLNLESVSRHATQHGKYVPEYYTKANSIKMLLVIDSIYWCIQCYENYKNDIHMESQ